MSNTAKFWDRMAKGYAKRPVADQASYDQKLALTQAHFTPETVVLEFGCGTGTTAIHHAPHVASIRATDISGEMLAIAKAKADTAGVSNVTFEQTSVEALEAEPGAFDVVLGMSILHLVDDHAATLARIFELTKPGGVFISSTMCLKDGYGWFGLIGPIAKLFGLLPKITVFSQAELVDAISAAGFVIEHEWQPAPKKAVFIVARRPEF